MQPPNEYKAPGEGMTPGGLELRKTVGYVYSIRSTLAQILELARILLEHPSWLKRPEHRAMLRGMLRRICRGGLR